MFDNIVIAGIPVVAIVFGLVEFCKRLGAKGNLLTALSLVIAALLFAAYTFVSTGFPVTPQGWVTMVITGVVFGLSASGIYDFINARVPKAAK